ncbi:uncharacterized protein LOC118456758 [Anopheles albimanus]|uniref:uncharacterized protein LOC118456758 n=1 Tax=Anopheles albimanus TaxID=7167 RepID=UPI00164075A5|nr:uncharacterized protein LOC118456758 [Anopheles albimanus]XP_035773716.1 uncharacterized protein LOC118456758 [Anopheles albimanus]
MWQVIPPPFHLATNDMTERIKKFDNSFEGDITIENDIFTYCNGTQSTFFESTSPSSSSTSTITEASLPQAGIKRSASLLDAYSGTETQATVTTPPTVKKARTMSPAPVPDLEATCGEMLAQMMRASKLAPKEKFMFTSFVQRCFYLFDEGSLDLHGKLPLIVRPKKRL